MTLPEAIKFYEITDDENTKKLCVEIIGDYYSKNLPAHLEYIEKGIYDEPEMAEYLTEFRANMEKIERILKS